MKETSKVSDKLMVSEDCEKRKQLENEVVIVVYGKCQTKENKSIIVIDSPGCSWERCRFCAARQQTADENTAILQVIRCFEKICPNETKLQIVTSASYSDYTIPVQDLIIKHAQDKGIKTIILEQRWGLRYLIPDVNAKFNEVGIVVEWILGLECLSREDRLFLGKEDYITNIQLMRQHFKRVNLLFGYDGKRSKSLKTLIEEVDVLLKVFNVISINIYENALGSDIKRDEALVEEFYNSSEFTEWKNDPRIHIFDIDPRAESDFGGIDTFARAD